MGEEELRRDMRVGIVRAVALMMLCLCAGVMAGCQVGEGLQFCDMYNGKTISTRGTLQGFDENARAMQKFLMGNPEASEACQEKVRTLVCAMKAANGDSKDVNNCDSAEV